MIPVVFHSFVDGIPARGYWDQNFLEEVFRGEVWRPVHGYDWEIKNLDEVNGCVLIIPARSHVEKIAEINEAIATLQWVVLILASDEENVFPLNEIVHPNKIIYLMSPDFDKDLSNADRYLGEGYPEKDASLTYQAKDRDVFFSGQVTHSRREQCCDALDTLDEQLSVYVNRTPGFTQGLERSVYTRELAKSKIIPAPSGPMTPDSFRFFEGLEYGCVPIADTLTPDGRGDRYWQRLFGSETVPFEIVKDWEHVGGNVSKVLRAWPGSGHQCYAWWQEWKRHFVYQLVEDVKLVSGVPADDNFLRDNLTVLMCTSPIRSHPSTDMINKTIASVRSRLPESEIIVMIDGVRPEQEYLRAEYEEYISRLLWEINFEYDNVRPMVFSEHMHQSGMTKAALHEVRTPCILFVEHDTPLQDEIEFEEIVRVVESGVANLVRLHHESHILVEHEHMMLDSAPVDIGGIKLMKTVQWSQRPHVASKDFYERILREHFSEHAKTMIEDVMHGIVHAPYVDRGRSAWMDFKLWMYAPDPNAMQRSGNFDGRGDEEKYGMVN